MKICIDAGHGGKDPGALGNGLREKDLTLRIALSIGRLLKNRGVEVMYTRTTDVFVELSDRAKAANAAGSNYFLSVHINAGGGSGFESFVYPSPAQQTVEYQKTIHRHVAAAYKSVGHKDRGCKQSNLAVLRETNMSAILLEYGFIDNEADAFLLADPLWIERIAQATVDGVMEAFGLDSAPTAKPTPKPALDPNIAQQIIDCFFIPQWHRHNDALLAALECGDDVQEMEQRDLRDWQNVLANNLRDAAGLPRE